MQATPQVIGIVWYELETYEAVRATMEDGLNLPATYSQWRLKAEQIERQLRRQGVKTVRALIRPEEFRLWCRERGLDVNAKSRNQFANEVALHHHQGGTTH